MAAVDSSENGFAQTKFEVVRQLAQFEDQPDSRDAEDAQPPLLEAVEKGQLKVLRRLLKQEDVDIDQKDTAGETVLFEACRRGRESIVNELLKQGAQVNLRSRSGATPVHHAVYGGSVKVLSLLIEFGGDLRLHDNMGRAVSDYCLLLEDLRKKNKMSEFIEKTRQYARTKSGTGLFDSSECLQRSSSIRIARQTSSIISLFKKQSSFGQLSAAGGCSVANLGFGHSYCTGAGEVSGVIAIIPQISESELHYPNNQLTYNNGTDSVMASMMWNRVIVTIRELGRLVTAGRLDVLIREAENLGKLRHPSILTLMALCPSDDLQTMSLVFENVSLGSLFHALHEKNLLLMNKNIYDIMLQVCSALAYIHDRGMLHCYLSSHSVQLTSPNIGKLSNFEYAVRQAPTVDQQRKSEVVMNTATNAAYNWMAPELMTGYPPTVRSDLYSLSALILEIFTREIPWANMPANRIKHSLSNGNTLPVERRIPEQFARPVAVNLSTLPDTRGCDLVDLMDLFKAGLQSLRTAGQRAVQRRQGGPHTDRQHPAGENNNNRYRPRPLSDRPRSETSSGTSPLAVTSCSDTPPSKGHTSHRRYQDCILMKRREYADNPHAAPSGVEPGGVLTVAQCSTHTHNTSTQSEGYTQTTTATKLMTCGGQHTGRRASDSRMLSTGQAELRPPSGVDPGPNTTSRRNAGCTTSPQRSLSPVSSNRPRYSPARSDPGVKVAAETETTTQKRNRLMMSSIESQGVSLKERINRMLKTKTQPGRGQRDHHSPDTTLSPGELNPVQQRSATKYQNRTFMDSPAEQNVHRRRDSPPVVRETDLTPDRPPPARLARSSDYWFVSDAKKRTFLEEHYPDRAFASPQEIIAEQAFADDSPGGVYGGHRGGPGGGFSPPRGGSVTAVRTTSVQTSPTVAAGPEDYPDAAGTVNKDSLSEELQWDYNYNDLSADHSNTVQSFTRHCLSEPSGQQSSMLEAKAGGEAEHTAAVHDIVRVFESNSATDTRSANTRDYQRSTGGSGTRSAASLDDLVKQPGSFTPRPPCTAYGNVSTDARHSTPRTTEQETGTSSHNHSEPRVGHYTLPRADPLPVPRCEDRGLAKSWVSDLSAIDKEWSGEGRRSLLETRTSAFSPQEALQPRAIEEPINSRLSSTNHQLAFPSSSSSSTLTKKSESQISWSSSSGSSTIVPDNISPPSVDSAAPGWGGGGHYCASPRRVTDYRVSPRIKQLAAKIEDVVEQTFLSPERNSNLGVLRNITRSQDCVSGCGGPGCVYAGSGCVCGRHTIIDHKRFRSLKRFPKQQSPDDKKYTTTCYVDIPDIRGRPLAGRPLGGDRRSPSRPGPPALPADKPPLSCTPRVEFVNAGTDELGALMMMKSEEVPPVVVGDGVLNDTDNTTATDDILSSQTFTYQCLDILADHSIVSV